MATVIECSVCLTAVEVDLYQTYCHHDFHRACLQEWCSTMVDSDYVERPHSSCPICRTPISAEQRLSIFNGNDPFNLPSVDPVVAIQPIPDLVSGEPHVPLHFVGFQWASSVARQLDEEFIMDRMVYESRARARFNNVHITFNYRGSLDYTNAVWIIHSYGRRNWMPENWIRSLRGHRGHTLEAFRLSQDGAFTVCRVYNGMAPRRLYTCRFCNNYVFNDYIMLRSHIQMEHPARNLVRDISDLEL